MEVTGKVIKVMPMQSGMGKNGEWRKQEFVIETPGTYPKKIALTVWNERTADLQALALGQEVKAYVDIESREYNERWYTDVKAWKIEKVITGAINATPGSNESHQASSPPVPPPPSQDFNSGNSNPFGDSNDPSQNQEDDLPF